MVMTGMFLIIGLLAQGHIAAEELITEWKSYYRFSSAIWEFVFCLGICVKPKRKHIP
uniref:Uncharacterized protein n=1 Tax=Octopus bimaculoides TaxID=37653 RepID=A0A0L8H4C5_OCTBM